MQRTVPRPLPRFDAEDCWKAYVGEMSAADFVRQYDSRDPEVCAAYWLRHIGSVFGIARRGTWAASFAPEDQVRREVVAAMIATYLEDHRAEWEHIPIDTGPPTTWHDMEQMQRQVHYAAAPAPPPPSAADAIDPPADAPAEADPIAPIGGDGLPPDHTHAAAPRAEEA